MIQPHTWQTDAVEAYHRLGGVFVGLDPGTGKSYAAAQIARRCVRPLVLAPAGAIPQTRAQFESYGVPTAEAKWGPQSDGTVAFASYQWLTRATQADFFERFRPTDVLMDEFHEVRGLGNSARKRLERYLVANHAVRVGVFTGSPMSSGLTDFAFGLTWALRGGVRGLVPQLRSGVEALTEKLAADPAARAAFRARVETTPGVFLDVGDAGRYAGEVVITVHRREPVAVLADTWILPDGWAIDSPAQAAAVSKMLAWGWYPTADPRPSAELLEARRVWAATCRRVIDSGAADTPAQVRDLRPREAEAYTAAVAGRAEGETTPVWLARADPERVAEGVLRLGNCLVWAHHRALQDRVAAAWRAPLHREGGRDAAGVRLDETRASLAVASIEACHQSHNAQHFSDNIVLEPPSDPEVWKQLIGRTARQGQGSPHVHVDVVVNCPAAAQALRGAIQRAIIVKETTGKGNPLLQLEGKNW